MDPRPLARMRRAAAPIVLALGLLALGGCDPRQALYFLQPFEPRIPAPCTVELKGKRVVVITKAAPAARNDFVTIDRDVQREITAILRKEVRKIDLVDPDKVYAWDQAHPSWTDASELGEAFEADVVISLEVEQFQIQNPSSVELYEGQAAVRIQVTQMLYPEGADGKPMKDKPREGKVVYEDISVTTFPSRAPMPITADVPRPVFKSKFLRLVATEVSWHFLGHAHGDEIQDVSFRK